MPDYSDDSDEELGAYIYRTSRTAQLLREEAAARNIELTTKNDNNITIPRPKRKCPREVENLSVSSQQKMILNLVYCWYVYLSILQQPPGHRL